MRSDSVHPSGTPPHGRYESVSDWFRPRVMPRSEPRKCRISAGHSIQRLVAWPLAMIRLAPSTRPVDAWAHHSVGAPTVHPTSDPIRPASTAAAGSASPSTRRACSRSRSSAHIYGVNEKQMRGYFDKATRSKAVTGEEMTGMLECRLDTVLFAARVRADHEPGPPARLTRPREPRRSPDRHPERPGQGRPGGSRCRPRRRISCSSASPSRSRRSHPRGSTGTRTRARERGPGTRRATRSRSRSRWKSASSSSSTPSWPPAPPHDSRDCSALP